MMAAMTITTLMATGLMAPTTPQVSIYVRKKVMQANGNVLGTLKGSTVTMSAMIITQLIAQMVLMKIPTFVRRGRVIAVTTICCLATTIIPMVTTVW